jgi:hypothetical protein
MAETPRITSASWTVTFPEKPFWRDRWLYQEDWAGAALGLLSGQQLIQRFQVTSKAARSITLVCPIVAYADVEKLFAMANSEEAITVYPEEEGSGIPVVFRPVNPIELAQVGNDMADENKKTVGYPYDRYDVTLNLISLAS